MKYCPLLRYNCLEEDCAWFNTKHGACGMRLARVREVEG